MEFHFKPIGIIHSCYTDRFGIPRQPGLVRCATAALELLPPFNTADALRGMEGFSHLWIIFVFHASAREEVKATVRPPRLGGNERIGVFASRSNFRPNPIGLSVVELLGIDGTTLLLGGGDFLDKTPVLDIKPYLSYADCISEARSAFADSAPQPLHTVEFSAEAATQILSLENDARPALRQLIHNMLAYNPRPAYQTNDPDRIFGTTVFDLNVRWRQTGETVTVLEVGP